MKSADPASEELIRTIDYFLDLSSFLRAHVPAEVRESPKFKERERQILRTLANRSSHLPDHEPEVLAKAPAPLDDTREFARLLIRKARQTWRPR